MRGISPIYTTDFYKFGHQHQYPKDITQILTNWTPRYSRGENKAGSIVHFGTQYAIQRILQESWQEDFFNRPWRSVRNEYENFVNHTLFISKPDMEHIKAVHDLGYLPIRVYALPEGYSVPIGVPPVLFMNTQQNVLHRWLPNYLETIWSNFCWKPSTSATVAREYRRLFMRYAKLAGETNFDFVDYMGHDFSFRGMSGLDDAVLSGMGHLLFFRGTDTVPAIMEAQRYYSGVIDGGSLGCSVPATEHSVMCSDGSEGELDTFRRLLTEVYPAGILSVVSDTWDLWKVLTEYIPSMRKDLDKRDGKLVIRPDSGDPVKILCGDPDHRIAHGSHKANGVLRLLRQAMGSFDRSPALPLLGKPHALYGNTIGAIYGDSITLARADEILSRTVSELKLSPYNLVFGIGSYTYEYTTRDQYGWAMKATAVRRGNGEWQSIFKKPVTDDGGKFSAKGLLAVYNAERFNKLAHPLYHLQQEVTEAELNNCAYEVVYEDGDLEIEHNFKTIRERARSAL